MAVTVHLLDGTARRMEKGVAWEIDNMSNLLTVYKTPHRTRVTDPAPEGIAAFQYWESVELAEDGE